MTDTTAATAMMRRHIEAFTRMTLGKKMMKPGFAIVAGTLLSEAGIIRIATMAQESGQDIVHLDFAIDGDTVVLREIIVAIARDHHCHVLRDCRLAQRPGDRRAVLMPGAHIRGHFRIASDEIIHVDGQPRTLLNEGIAFARRRFNRLLGEDVNLDKQVRITEVA